MVLLWLGLPLALVYAWRTERAAPRPEDRAIEILSERFARGELDRAEYEARRTELTR